MQNPENTPQVRTRSGRRVLRPSYLQDYEVQEQARTTPSTLQGGHEEQQRHITREQGSDMAQGRSVPFPSVSSVPRPSVTSEVHANLPWPPVVNPVNIQAAEGASGMQNGLPAMHFFQAPPEQPTQPFLLVSPENISQIINEVMLGLRNNIFAVQNNNLPSNNVPLYVKPEFSVKDLPKFKNDSSLHPMDFLQNLENIINVRSIVFSDLRCLIGNSFEGDAKIWFDAHTYTFLNYDHFRSAFIEQFWGDMTQLQFRLKLDTGRYTEGSFVNHFNFYVCLARHLNPPLSAKLLIATIARHFPPNIASTLIGANSLNEALEKLRQADYYFSSSNNTYLSENKKPIFIKNDSFRVRPGDGGVQNNIFSRKKVSFTSSRNVSSLDLENNVDNVADVAENELTSQN